MIESKDKKHLNVLKELNLGGKIRGLRLKKGLTLKDVSEKTGFSTALLSQIENNIVSPPISTLWKVAQALDVKLTYFFQQSPVEHQDYFIVRKGKGKSIFRHESRYAITYSSLGYGKEDRKMDPYIAQFTGEEEPMEALGHDGEEFLYVLKGRIHLTYGDRVIILEEGDSIYYDSRVMHMARGSADTVLLAVVYTGKSNSKEGRKN